MRYTVRHQNCSSQHGTASQAMTQTGAHFTWSETLCDTAIDEEPGTEALLSKACDFGIEALGHLADNS